MVWTSFQSNSFQSNSFQILAGETETKRSGIWRLELIRLVTEQQEKRRAALVAPLAKEKPKIVKSRPQRKVPLKNIVDDEDFWKEFKDDDWIPLPKISPQIVDYHKQANIDLKAQIAKVAQIWANSLYKTPNYELNRMAEQHTAAIELQNYNTNAIIALGII